MILCPRFLFDEFFEDSIYNFINEFSIDLKKYLRYLINYIELKYFLNYSIDFYILYVFLLKRIIININLNIIKYQFFRFRNNLI